MDWRATSCWHVLGLGSRVLTDAEKEAFVRMTNNPATDAANVGKLRLDKEVVEPLVYTGRQMQGKYHFTDEDTLRVVSLAVNKYLDTKDEYGADEIAKGQTHEQYRRGVMSNCVTDAAREIADDRSLWGRDRSSLDATLGDGEGSATFGDMLATKRDFTAMPPTVRIRNLLKRKETRPAALAMLRLKQREELQKQKDAKAEAEIVTCESAAFNAPSAGVGFKTDAFSKSALKHEKVDLFGDDKPFVPPAVCSSAEPPDATYRHVLAVDVGLVMQTLTDEERKWCKLILDENYAPREAAKEAKISDTRLSRVIRPSLRKAFAHLRYAL